MRVAVRFSDNDFGGVWWATMRALNDIYLQEGEDGDELFENFKTNRPKLELILDHLAFTMYVLHNRHAKLESLESRAKYFDYLSKDSKHPARVNRTLLFDEEIDACAVRYGGEDIYVIDTDLNYENNDPVYIQY